MVAVQYTESTKQNAEAAVFIQGYHKYLFSKCFFSTYLNNIIYMFEDELKILAVLYSWYEYFNCISIGDLNRDVPNISLYNMINILEKV